MLQLKDKRNLPKEKSDIRWKQQNTVNPFFNQLMGEGVSVNAKSPLNRM